MCGRITLRTNLHAIATEFQAPLPGFAIVTRYNVSPGQLVLALRGADQREIVQLKRGLIPSWSKNAKIAFSCLNARADTVKTKPAFRSAYKSRRCLVPADGYYEWLREGKESCLTSTNSAVASFLSGWSVGNLDRSCSRRR